MLIAHCARNVWIRSRTTLTNQTPIIAAGTSVLRRNLQNRRTCPRSHPRPITQRLIPGACPTTKRVSKNGPTALNRSQTRRRENPVTDCLIRCILTQEIGSPSPSRTNSGTSAVIFGTLLGFADWDRTTKAQDLPTQLLTLIRRILNMMRHLSSDSGALFCPSVGGQAATFPYGRINWTRIWHLLTGWR